MNSSNAVPVRVVLVLMRLLLPLPLLFLAPALPPQEPVPSPLPTPGDAEPPVRYTLRCGVERLEFSAGESFTIPDGWGGRACALERLPLRRFTFPGALAFEYPDGARWLGATFVPEFQWWDVVGDGEMVALQRHVGTGDAAHHRDLYAENSLKVGGEDLGPCTIALDGREIAGRRIAGWTDRPFTQEIYAFEHAGATWLLLIHRDRPEPDPSRIRLGPITVEMEPLPAWPAPAGALPGGVAARFLSSFRFL